MSFFINDAMAQSGSAAGGGLMGLLPMILLFVVFYLLLIRPQQKRQKESRAGIWDCLQCTYENLPYAPTCGLCGSKAPPGTLVFQDIPSNVKFGLELEEASLRCGRLNGSLAS